jgi:hypothetical protein
MICCCCGEDAGRWAQHWSRDSGFDVCVRCVTEQREKGTPESEIRGIYGTKGVNWGGEMNERTEVNWCVCGCGEAIGEHRTWVPGHDLKAVSWELDRLNRRMLDLARVLRKRRRDGVQDD